jgi:hypothetical protein
MLHSKGFSIQYEFLSSGVLLSTLKFYYRNMSRCAVSRRGSFMLYRCAMSRFSGRFRTYYSITTGKIYRVPHYFYYLQLRTRKTLPRSPHGA